MRLLCQALILIFVVATVNAEPSITVGLLHRGSFASGQNVSPIRPVASTEPQETVRQFYEWYLRRLNKEDYDPLKNRAMALRYLTPKFLLRIPRLEREMEADVIVCSQDVNPAWLKDFKADLASIRGARATVVLALEGSVADTIKQKVTLVRTHAGWRIDSVNCGR
jgi:hypothetical protein